MIEPLHPETLYPQVAVRNDRQAILTCYGSNLVTLDPAMPRESILINAMRSAGLLMTGLPDSAACDVEIKDCRGDALRAHQFQASGTAVSLDVAPAEFALLTPVPHP